MKSPWLHCLACEAEHPLAELYRCPACGGELQIVYDTVGLRKSGALARTWRLPGSIWQRFSALLPQQDAGRIVSLGEGSTPLVPSERLAARLGVKAAYLKLESSNPTGSFKDRQISIAMSKAREWGRTGFGTASSGNVGVALAAYAARAGLKAQVWVSASVAAAKRQQIQVYGARLFLTPENTPEHTLANQAFFNGMQAFCIEQGLVPMVSARPVNPYMVEGGKTIAFEVAAELAQMPDRFFAPVGGGGCMGGCWKGFMELHEAGLTEGLPKLEGAQMVKGHVPVDRMDDPAFSGPEFFRPLDGHWAWQAIQATGGSLRPISAQETQAAQADLAAQEGVFAEPQGVTAYAGLLKAAQEGALRSDETVVCVITGAGLKDMDAARMICEEAGYFTPRPVRTLAGSVPDLVL